MSIRKKRRVEGLIFDLDGTLVDSFADLATAVNLTRHAYGKEALPLPQVKQHVGNGVAHLVRKTVNVPPDLGDEALQRFMTHYADHVCDETRLLPGVQDVLRTFAERPMAIVTNKPQRFAERIVETLDLSDCFALVLGGDALPQKKPDPAPVRAVLERFALAPDTMPMIGDGVNDVRAGRGAGVLTIALTTGVEDADTLRAENPDHLLEHMAQVLDLLE